MNRTLAAAAFSLLLLAAAQAHEEAKGPNGGPLADASGHHLEFVDKGNELSLFVNDEGGRALDTKGTTGGRAIVYSDGKTETVPLTPAEPNRLVGTLPRALSSGARVVVSATMSDGHAIQARFVKN